MKRLGWLLLAGSVVAPFSACGPDEKPGPACEGPTFNLLLRAEGGPLPTDTLLNVRFGGNHDGEAYELGSHAQGQSVFCDELGEADASATGGAGPSEARSMTAAGSSGQAGGDADADERVWLLSCRLYTQGPARIDVSATGYEPIEQQDLKLDGDDRCRVEVEVELKLMLDAGT